MQVKVKRQTKEKQLIYCSFEKSISPTNDQKLNFMNKKIRGRFDIDNNNIVTTNLNG